MPFDPAFEANFFTLYEERQELYSIALGRVNEALRAVSRDRSRHTIAEQRRIRVEQGRVKEANRLWLKASLPKYGDRIQQPEDVFTAITDIAGIRITCNTVEDVHRITRAIRESSTLRPLAGADPSKVYEDYVGAPKESGYRAVHLLVEVDVPHGSGSISIPCEIQIRTLLQNAWGELTHEDTFKPGVEVPPLVSSLSKRLATALAVLDEIAQDLRDELNKLEKGSESESAPSEDKNPLQSELELELREAFADVYGRQLAASPAEILDLLQALAQQSSDSRLGIRDLLSTTREAEKVAYAEHHVILGDGQLLAAASRIASGNNAQAVLTNASAAEAALVARQVAFSDTYRPGSEHMATVIRATPRYCIVRLGEGADAIVSARHLEPGRERVRMDDLISPGDTIRVRIVNVDASRSRIEARLAS